MFISAFGFAAALLEGLPLIGLVFTLSNRIGAAMWAHGMLTLYSFSITPRNIQYYLDLEKRQHFIAELKAR